MRYWGIIVSVATLVVGTAFPAYRSLEALESKGSLDDSQWLTYWILMAFMTLAERSLAAFVRLVPLYAEGKLVLLAFLALPPLNGAELLYYQARPTLLKGYNYIKKQLATIRGEAPDALGLSNETIELRGRVSSSCRTIDATLSKLFAAVAAGKMPAGDLAAKLDKLDSLIAAEDNVPAADKFYEAAKIESIPKFDDGTAGNMTAGDVADITGAPATSGSGQQVYASGSATGAAMQDATPEQNAADLLS